MTPTALGYRSLLALYLRPQWRRALLLAVLLLSSIALQLISPQILRTFIDTATSGGAARTLTGIALLFLTTAVAGQAVVVAETYVAENIGWTATNTLRADLTLHCLLLDPQFHHAHPPGELIERVDGDVAKLANFFSRFVVQILGNALLLAGVLAVSFTIDWRAGVTLTLFALVAAAIMYRLRHIGVRRWAEASQAGATLFGFIEERISGTEDLRSCGATDYALRGLGGRLRELLRTTRRAAVLGGATFASVNILLALGTALSLGLGVYLFQAGSITLGSVYLIYAYAELLRRPIEEISRQIADLQRATASIGRIRDLLAERSAIADGPGAALPAGALSVVLEQVSFAYDDEPEARILRLEASDESDQAASLQSPAPSVLSDVSFALAPGGVLGLLGRTGSGKTTMSRLLFRLYDPTGGVVRIGGVDPRAAKLADLRARVGMVTQDIQLFHATVRDNLTFFDARIADERIERVLADLGLERWLRGLPDGLGTKLAPDGSGLSAGEAQLLAFARVFLQDPGLVILDEASSRLDPATEAAIEHAIDRLLAGRTAIIIAHRLHTVQRADAILILERGRVVEHGPRERLARDADSRFARLLRTGMEELLA
jgi:ABC-type multidrug transport system fused ATPase/permease subunit